MSMIKSLTPSQESQFEPHVQKWLKIGLSTEPCNVERSRYWIRKAYQVAGLEPPTKWVVYDSPLSCVQAQVRDHIQTSEYLWDRIYNQVRHQVITKVWDQVRHQVGNQVWHKVQAPVRVQVQDQVMLQIWEQIDDQVDKVFGPHDVSWLSLYDYYLQVLKLDCVKPIVPLINLAKHCGWWAPYENVCHIQHRPQEIHMHNKLLHKDGGPAILYRDGLSAWALNGVRVPQWLSETRTENIDPRKLLEIDNAQVRAEFVRKVGIERVCYALKAKCVDKKGNYELLMLDLQDGRNRPHLKMLNPSVPDLWHIEGVHPDCVDVASALKWRNGGIEEAPTVLT